MKAIICPRYGPPEILALAEVEKPVPNTDEILIKIAAAGVFPGDTEIRGARFPLSFQAPLRLLLGVLRPRRKILGQEIAGVVEAVGAGVTRFRPGEKVLGATDGFGGYAEYIALPESEAIAVKPEIIPFDEAAVTPVGALNALHFIRKAELERGEKILINGAGGSIGSFAVQLARHFGAEVWAVDKADKLPMLSGIGAHHVIDFMAEDFTRLGHRFDVILDVIGKSRFGPCWKTLAPRGRYILANPRPGPMLRGCFASKREGKRTLFALAKTTAADLEFICRLIEEGAIHPVLDRRFLLTEAAAAHRYIESGAKQGGVALIVAQPG